MRSCARDPARFCDIDVWICDADGRDACRVSADHAPQAGGTARREADAQRGQASLEYVGALGVLAAVLVLAAGFVGGGVVLNGVLRGLERALCRVAGGDCLATELAACTVRSKETGGQLGLKLTFVRLGGSLALLREELSDGSVDVSLVDGLDAAPTAGLGASGGVRLGSARLGGGAITRAELLVRLGRRRVWHRADAGSADRLVEDIVEHVAAGAGERSLPFVGTELRRAARAVGVLDDRLPVPDVTALSAGLEGVAEAGLGELGTATAGLAMSLGGSRDRATGRRTLVFAVDGQAGAALSRAAGGMELGGSGGATVSVTFGRGGEPVELAVGVAGAGRGDLRLGLPRHRGGAGGAERVELSARLDLGRPANRAAYDAFFAALGRGPGHSLALARAAVALTRQVGAAARRDLARYAVDAKHYGADAEVALGARAGASVKLSQTTSLLRDAWTRPAGGAWERRTDCATGASRA